MKCPACTNTELEFRDIDVGLGAGVCSNCKGRWVSLESYHAWLEFADHRPATEVEENMTEPVTKYDKARICPRCRRILTKYKIAVESPLKIDRCSNCAGAWLDAADWAALKSMKFHAALDRIFTDHWQNSISREETRQTLTAIYKRKFGPENFERVREFKKWVFDQENHEELLSYIRDRNPLQL
ncbi:MAG: zf-TFIIB domain-containing protein [Acidobacteriota bacterium]|nr:zf-TFIIB domain-containing protein [Acidobacteriota bacterium]MDH3530825.1 zf-TFIIB domain-containing protein [Acidobacteriota bacterium]